MEVFAEILLWLARALIALIGCWWVVISVWAVTDLVRERPIRYRRVVVSFVIGKTVPGLLIVAAALTGRGIVLIAAFVIAVGSGIVGSVLERLGLGVPVPGQQAGGDGTQ